jgi:hypothetical protein
LKTQPESQDDDSQTPKFLLRTVISVILSRAKERLSSDALLRSEKTAADGRIRSRNCLELIAGVNLNAAW